MSKTFLVVDDEMLIAIDIQTQLEDLGHRVLVATALREAVGLVENEHIDVAIVDWHIRNEVSAPLIALLKQRLIPFVLCSGSALDQLADLFPASPIVQKPYAAADLLHAVSQLVERGTIN